MSRLPDVSGAIKKALPGPKQIIEWLLLSFVIFFLLFMIPVWTTPGDDLLFQLSITPPFVIVLMGILSVANALIIMFQLYIRKTVRSKRKIHAKAAEGATAIGIMFGSFVATLGCAACYSSILAVLGLGTTAFIVENRVWISLVTLALTVGAIFYSARRINNHCDVCVAPYRKSI